MPTITIINPGPLCTCMRLTRRFVIHN